MRDLIPEPIRLTYEDYCALPEDRQRWEILDGDAYARPTPFTIHQLVVGNLLFTLAAHAERERLGRVFPYLDVLLSKHDIVVPDVIFVSRARKPIITEKNILGAPDLLVEVTSEFTIDRDRRDMRNIYARRGVPFYWIVDPDRRSVLELQLVEKAYAPVAELVSPATFKSQLFPELAIELQMLWE